MQVAEMLDGHYDALDAGYAASCALCASIAITAAVGRTFVLEKKSEATFLQRVRS